MFIVLITLHIVKLIYALFGLGLVALGVQVINRVDELFENLLGHLQLNVKILPYVFIGFGVIFIVMFLLAFCAFCVTVVESKRLLISYAVITAILAAAKIYLAIELFTQTSDMRERVDTFMNEASNDPALNKTFHALEIKFRCCGTTGPDYYNITIEGISYLPPTCCRVKNWEDSSNFCHKEDAYQQGCSPRISDVILNWSKSVGYFLIGIIATEFLVLVVASYGCILESGSYDFNHPEPELHIAKVEKHHIIKKGSFLLMPDFVTQKVINFAEYYLKLSVKKY